jgi:response regulator of citrate/malate metabolism
MMPGNDGVWLVEQIRSRWPDTTVIMATAVQDTDLVRRMRVHGAVDYVSKPFGREMVRQALVRAATLIESRESASVN